jgi:precorrin 3B synthase CobZ
MAQDSLSKPWDIVVIGSGAAGLTSALSALTHASPPPSVLLLDKAPLGWAGGNGYFTAGAYRTVHHGLPDILPLVSNVSPERDGKIDLPSYKAEDFRGDLDRVTGGRSDPVLGRYLVGESLETVRWLKEVGGVEWWLSFRRQAYEVDGRWQFWGGLHLTVKDGGKGLIKNLTQAARGKGCVIEHEVAVKRLLTDNAGAISGVEVERAGSGKKVEVQARSVIMCAGGFEANPELRKKYLAPGWEAAHTRGTPYNTGDMLTASLALGAKLVGDFSTTGCHSVAWDFDSPANGGDREKTNEFTKSGYPLGVMVNSHGQRFVDEGIDLRNYTYAKFGRAILEQPQGIAWQIWDSEGTKWLRDEEYRDEIVRKVWANSLEGLAEKLAQDGLQDPAALLSTLHEFNSSVAHFSTENPDIKLNPAIKDGLSTQSSSQHLQLAKSNWALPISKPPFLAVKVTSGITFTFGGLAIDPEDAGVLREDGTKIQGLHCAGEMVGGLFYGNYPGGSGLTAGAVFGRRAGRAAAERARAAGVGGRESRL